MKRLIIATSVMAVLAGCSTVGTKTAEQAPLPSPTPAVVKDQTVAAQGKLDAPQTIDLPAWYIKAPASTEDFVYLSGTGYSSDLSMSHQKALLDAQLKLADKINGVLNALVKQYKDDNAGTVNADKTSIAIKKVIADTAITGYHIEDSRVLSENRSYRTFVLVRYPIGDANRLLKDKLQRENQNMQGEEAAQRELEQEIQNRKPKAKAQATPAPVSLAEPSPVVVSPITQAPQPQSIQLMQVDNEEYKKRRDEALAKPGAVIGQTVVR
jgi:uncharacterized protein YceK